MPGAPQKSPAEAEPFNNMTMNLRHVMKDDNLSVIFNKKPTLK
jgi:hypothetical protein